MNEPLIHNLDFQDINKKLSISEIKHESIFESSWLRIQESFENLRKDKSLEEEKEVKDFLTKKKKKKEKNKKGKNIEFRDKLSSADIKDWKEQKLHIASFMEYLKTLFKEAKSEDLNYSFGNYLDIPNSISCDISLFEENDHKFHKMDITLKNNIDNYGNMMADHYIKKGLTIEEVERRKAEYGLNQLPEKKKTPEIIKYLKEITNVFSNLLWIAAILAFIGYSLDTSDKSNMFLGIVIVLIVLVTGVLSYYQNSKSEAIMESIKQLSKLQVIVVRQPKQGTNKEEQTVNSSEIVPGDVVIIKSGQKIPADIRIIKSTNLQIDNSSLTGESIAIELGPNCGEEGKSDPLHALNLAFFSTLCKDGYGKGIVIRTGPNTYMGKIADLTSSAEGVATTLQQEMNNFIWKIAYIATFLGISFWIMGYFVGYPPITNFLFAIGIVIANVPEGLMSTMTICLTIAAKRMFKNNIMVKNLQSVETLGAITCICSDKTGTLTQNKMKVTHLWYDNQIKKVSEDQEDIVIDHNLVEMKVYDEKDPSFSYMRFVGICGSTTSFLQDVPDNFPEFLSRFNAWKYKNPRATEKETAEKAHEIKTMTEVRESYQEFYNNNIEERLCDGDASETGIIKFFEKQGEIEKLRHKYPIHSVDGDDGVKKEVMIPFNSTNKFAAYLRKSSNEDEIFLLAMKGAPDKLIERCKRYIYNGVEKPIDDKFKQDFTKANKCFALKGERVIALAYCRLNPNKYHENYPFEIMIKAEDPIKTNLPIDDLCFVGLIAMEDPPREGVKNAITLCKRAGIKVIMVTGDQYLTAASIAYQIGIIENLDDTPEIIKESKQLKSIEEAENFSQAIIISGDRLHKKLKEEEDLSENNPQKGVFLRNWLMKRDVVFARTSPDQKLIIVDGCQRLSHVVAVTGDGVNDSPAIKKSDIGIAMGKVGTEVAKEAADIILLDDNFSNIVKGIKRGRIIFDCLKKVTGYNLTSNVTELIPFLGFVLLQFPLPLTTVLILCMDVFSNIYPNISLASEGAESIIMDRKPRNIKTDSLCTLKLFSWSYLFLGIIMCSGCFMNYFVVLNDYGFKQENLFFFSNKYGWGSKEIAKELRYNPYDTDFYGNSYAFIAENSILIGLSLDEQLLIRSYHRQFDYTTEADINLDLRMFFPQFSSENDFWGDCRIDSLDITNEGSICWTPDAIRHAQTSFFAGMITMQIANGLCYRTISESIYTHVLKNWMMNIAYLVEITIVLFLNYTPYVNSALGFRALRWEHYIPTLSFFGLMLLFDELRKLLVRRSKRPDQSPGWFFDYFFY